MASPALAPSERRAFKGGFGLNLSISPQEERELNQNVRQRSPFNFVEVFTVLSQYASFDFPEIRP